MSFYAFEDVFAPSDLAASLCETYGFSDGFRDYLARFLDQAPTSFCGGLRTLDEFAFLFSVRLGWSRAQARHFVSGEWALSLLPPDFEHEIMKLEGVA